MWSGQSFSRRFRRRELQKRGVHNPSPFAFCPLPAAQIKSPASVPP
jgi:hypothetical protein